MKIAINAVSAKMGGALTYVGQMLPELSRRVVDEEGGQLILWSGRGDLESARRPSISLRYDRSVSERAGMAGTLDRIFFDQARVPYWLMREKADALFSTANFGPILCRCHHILLVCNTIYFDEVFLGRAHAAVRAKYLMQRALVLAGMAAADILVFPSEAMQRLAMDALSALKVFHKKTMIAPFGVRHDLFFPNPEQNSQNSQNSIDAGDNSISLLNVSHYCDQKNLGTLFLAMEILCQKYPRRFHLKISAGIEQKELEGHPHYPNLVRERDQFRALQQSGSAVDLGTLPYAALPALYRSANLFVFPSYTESFGFPLVEAMASGLPIVASDIPVMREQCGDAAVYANVFDPLSLSEAILRVATDMQLRQSLRKKALERAKRFNWEAHVEQLMKAFHQR